MMVVGKVNNMERARPHRIMGIRRSTVLMCLFVVFYTVYLAAGGLIFAALEGPVERDFRIKLISAKEDFLTKFPSVTDEALEELLQLVVEAGNRGVSATRNATGEPNWSFGQSFFFSSTVATTIGYGHVTPLSQGGKVFCIFYAVFGIPLTLILLSALVRKLMIPASVFLRFLEAKLGSRLGMLSIRLLHLTAVALGVAIIALIIPACAFAQLEPDWDFLDAFYYCFISLTTIGLGDYIPGDSPNQQYRPLYKVFTSVYLLVGLTFVMLCLSIFSDIPELNVGHFFEPSADDLTMDQEKVRLNQSRVADHHTIIKVSSRRDLDDEDDDDYSRP